MAGEVVKNLQPAGENNGGGEAVSAPEVLISGERSNIELRFANVVIKVVNAMEEAAKAEADKVVVSESEPDGAEPDGAEPLLTVDDEGESGDDEEDDEALPELVVDKDEQKPVEDEQEASDEAKPMSELTPEEMKRLKEILSGYKDRNGNKFFSDDTIDRLVKNGRAVDPVQEERDAAIKKAREEAYKSAQMEMARILDGRSVNKYLIDAHRNLLNLQGEIERLRESRYTDPALEAMRKRHLTEAGEELLAMNRRRKMIENLRKGGEADPVGANEYDDFSAVSADLDLNQPEENVTGDKMIEAAFARIAEIAPLFSDDPEAAAGILRMWEAYKKRGERKDEEADFAQGESGEVTDEEVAEAAAKAGEAGVTDTGEEKNKTKERKDAKKKKRREKEDLWWNAHLEKLRKVASETRPGSWMSDEEKVEAAKAEQAKEEQTEKEKEREKRVKRVAKKAHERKSFRKIVLGKVIGALVWLGGEVETDDTKTEQAQAVQAKKEHQKPTSNETRGNGASVVSEAGSGRIGEGQSDEDFLDFVSQILGAIRDDGTSAEQAT